LEEGINNMCLNEKAWIRCMSDQYQTSSAVVPGVPSVASAPDGIVYIVTLHYFMQVRNSQALPGIASGIRLPDLAGHASLNLHCSLAATHDGSSAPLVSLR